MRYALLIVAVAFPVLLTAQALSTEAIAHAQAGEAAQKLGHFDEAVKEFQQVTKLQPNLASGYANLGDAYLRSGNYAAATMELKHALELNSNLIGTHQALGVALLVQGDAEGALPHLEKTRSPELLGLAYLETGRLGSAILALHAALERQPGDSDLLYYFGRATALAAQRTAAEATKLGAGAEPKDGDQADVVTLQKALAEHPHDPDLLRRFARVAGQASQKSFEAILQQSQDSARAHQVRAERLLDAGRFPEAAREFAAAMRIRPYTAGVHMEVAEMFAAAKNWTAATVEYAREAELQPANPEPLYRLGAALLEKSEPQAALAAYRRADKLRPDSPAILAGLGQAAFQAKELDAAEQAWSRVLKMNQAGDEAARAKAGLEELNRSRQISGEGKR
jgi:tetratricopeptide (TPR) repeat protein